MAILLNLVKITISILFSRGGKFRGRKISRNSMRSGYLFRGRKISRKIKIREYSKNFLHAKNTCYTVLGWPSPMKINKRCARRRLPLQADQGRQSTGDVTNLACAAFPVNRVSQIEASTGRGLKSILLMFGPKLRIILTGSCRIYI